MPRCWGPEHRAHTTPHTHQPRPTGERQRCAPALNAPPPPPQDPSACGHTGTAVSPSHQRLGGVRGSSAVLTAVRPDNQRGVPKRAGEVRAHWPWVTAFGASRDPTQPNPPPQPTPSPPYPPPLPSRPPPYPPLTPPPTSKVGGGGDFVRYMREVWVPQTETHNTVVICFLPPSFSFPKYSGLPKGALLHSVRTAPVSSSQGPEHPGPHGTLSSQ